MNKSNVPHFNRHELLKNVDILKGNNNITCGNCVKKIVKNDNFVTCSKCTLNFHVKCVDISDVEKSKNWFCKSCFLKTCNDELPFSDCFIDLNCKLQKGLKIAHINIQSVINKVDYINILLHNNCIDVLCLTETWLTDDIDDAELNINGYSIYRLDRQNEKSHGGVMCYVKDSLSFKQNIDLCDKDIEALFIEINLPKTKPILVGNVYRPPSCTVDYLDILDVVFQKCNNIYDDVYILGDFNLDVSKTCNLRKVLNLANNSHMKQLITDYTRITETSKTILDLIFVSNPDHVISSGVHSLGLSDHSLTYVVRKLKQINLPPKKVRSRCFKNFNELEFINTIQTIDWDIICSIDDVNEALEKWQTLFTEACEKHAPFKEKRIKGHLPEWINGDFLRLSKDRDYYYAKAHKTNDAEDWKKAKSLRNKVNNMRYYLKKNYCNDAVMNNMHDSKNLWKTIKKIIPNKSSSVPNVISNNDVQSSKDTANEFNKYFTSIGNQLGSKFDTYSCNGNVKCPCNHVCSDQYCAVSKFKFNEITPEFVLNQILKMQNNKSAGLDQINVRLLKLAGPFVSRCLSYICNLSLNKSDFPDEWKKAKVTPIFKSGDRMVVGNYRPISVLSIVSKILERAVHDQLYMYLTNAGLLSNAQSGFRTNHSTSTTLLDVQDFILRNMDDGYATGVIFLDLKKAFDTVNHDILISKLKKYGIDDNEIIWFKSYLSNRFQTVTVNSTLSDLQNVNIGIPQGSILGPLLFIIFVNCLPYTVDYNCKTVMYADDTSLMCKAKNVVDLQMQLESCLSRIDKWFKANKLTLNVDKTKCMIFGTKHVLKRFNEMELFYDNIIIEKVSEFKYLGVKFDNNLSWSAHVDHLCKTISKRIGIIRRIKYFIPQHTIVMLSNALVLPHFDYASTVWTNFSSENHKKLQVLHNSLARTILSADIRTPINELMDTLQWIKLDSRWHNQLLLLVFKCLRNLSPSYLSSQFEYVHNTHTYITRNHSNNTLIVPKYKSNSGLRTFNVRGAYAWNCVSPTLRAEMETLSISQFKARAMILA